MDAFTQKMFVKELTENIAKSIIEKIEQGRAKFLKIGWY